MSTPMVEAPAPVAVPPVRPWYINRHLIGYSVTAVVAMVIGGGIGNSAVAEKPAKVVTTIKTVDVPGPAITVTVKVPGPTFTKTVTVTEPAPAPAVAMAGDGTYEVGVDVKPGTYLQPNLGGTILRLWAGSA